MKRYYCDFCGRETWWLADYPNAEGLWEVCYECYCSTNLSYCPVCGCQLEMWADGGESFRYCINCNYRKVLVN